VAKKAKSSRLSPCHHKIIRIRLLRLLVIDLANYIYKPDDGKKVELLDRVWRILTVEFRKKLNYSIKH